MDDYIVQFKVNKKLYDQYRCDIINLGHSIGGRGSVIQAVNTHMFSKDLRELSKEGLERIIKDLGVDK